MTERKKIRKWFSAWSDQKEEVWLQRMAQEGWQLDHYGLFTYTFKAAPPTKLIYRLDYRIGTQNQDYFKLFEEDGWNLVSASGGWYYFCKEDDGTDKLEIYTDAQSRAVKYTHLSNFVLFLVLMHVLSFWMPMMSSASRLPIWAGLTVAPITFLGLYSVYMLKRKAKKLTQYEIYK
ncbi:DUF2812 domain-containing protein [Terribacillus sp. 179-K 1B1 HS]